MTSRGNAPAPTPTSAPAPAAVPLPPVPPGFYRVQPGDTLSGIARSNGQNNRDLIAWNNLPDPNHIEVNQTLRVVPPRADSAVTPASASASTSAPAPAPVGAGPAIASTGAPAEPLAPGASTIALSWPARGPLLSRFDDTRNKGIDIGGAAGDPVRAAATGRVVYAGNGLRGYGNLIIVKSDTNFLTAYAHNRDLKVKEGDSVTKGQEIAEMGNSDSDRVKLHFEVRRDGKPVDPLRYLPPQ
jgi:lipoprotein NlpD